VIIQINKFSFIVAVSSGFFIEDFTTGCLEALDGLWVFMEQGLRRGRGREAGISE
jgi:hypothetical protein